MEEIENWADILGYEGLYMISDQGRVLSCEREKELRGGYKRYMPSKIKSSLLDKYGYPSIKLCKNGKKSPFTVHRLVANAFIPNPKEKATVNHINGIKHDNRICNLEWNTYSENIKHAFDTGLKVAAKYDRSKAKIRKGSDHQFSKKVNQLTINGDLVKQWVCAKDATRDRAFTATHISRCCHGLAPYHKGFKWEFA